MRKPAAWLAGVLTSALLLTGAAAPAWAQDDPASPPVVETSEPAVAAEPATEAEPAPTPDPTPAPEPASGFRSVAKPKLSGTAKVGRTLTAKTGKAKPAATGWSFQWYRNGALIAGATERTYVLTAADKGRRITVRAQAQREGYRPRLSAASKRTKKVAAGTLKTGKPAVTGVQRAGETLTVDPGAWTDGVEFSYQWSRAGTTISGAATAAYTLTPADEGLKITATVTGRLAGYTTRAVAAKTIRIPLPDGCQGAADDRTSKSRPFVVCGIVVVSKWHRISSDYRPMLVSVGLRRSGIASVQLEPETGHSLQALFDAARQAGHTLTVRSAYRSYATQQAIYYPGNKLAAPAGASEHQTGLAVDLAVVKNGREMRGYAFGASAAGRWVRANAARFGFIIRYPSGKQKYTGIPHEPWHLRYLGGDHATKVKASGLTLEQYLIIR